MAFSLWLLVTKTSLRSPVPYSEVLHRFSAAIALKIRRKTSANAPLRHPTASAALLLAKIAT